MHKCPNFRLGLRHGYRHSTWGYVLLVLSILNPCLTVPVWAGTCEDLVRAIAERSDAVPEPQGPQPFWVSLHHPNGTRIDATCYGSLADAVVEVVLEGVKPKDDYFETIERVAEALAGGYMVEIAVTAKECLARARTAASGQATINRSGLAVACTIAMDEEKIVRSTVALALARTEGGASSRRIASAKLPPKKKQRRKPVPSKDACFW